jgi:hypothetical protein
MQRRHEKFTVIAGIEEAGDWRRLHNEELRNLYISPSIIKVINQGL